MSGSITAKEIRSAYLKMIENAEKGADKPDQVVIQKHLIKKFYKNGTIPDHIQQIIDDDSISENTVIIFTL